ncbi:MAG: cytochrome c [Pyrinomonadaceae bacterium]
MSFKISAKLMAIAAVAAMGVFAAIPSAKVSATAVEVNTEAVMQASLYRAHCARCHGNDGHANTKEGRKTEADDLTEDSVKAMSTEKMTRIIRNGKGDMPGFASKLKATQIAGIVRYVRGL